jgi:hypothetical protein
MYVVVLHNICEQLGKCHGCVLIEILVYMNVQPETLPLEHMVTDIFERYFPSGYRDEFFLPVATHEHITIIV